MSNEPADDQLPQTDAVFDQPELVVNDHRWLQQGSVMVDVCVPQNPACHSGGLPIPAGKMLVHGEGGYRFVDEVTRR